MTTLHKLSLPRNISINDEEDDTFSTDLLRQFDKKRSRLHFELGFTSQEPSPESSIHISTPVSEYLDQEPIQLDNEEAEATEPQTTTAPPSNYSSHHTSSRRSISASDLLRRSSAYLKSKFQSIKRNKSQENMRAVDPATIDTSRPPTKLLMKTTITIPPAPPTQAPTSGTTTARSSYSPLPISNSTTTNTTTIITQYPPKPLVYSPIEPIIPADNNEDTPKPLLHRISMPLLRVYNDTSTSLSRNRSITSFVTKNRRKSEPDNHTKRKTRPKSTVTTASTSQQL